jgi:hypothetical protein
VVATGGEIPASLNSLFSVPDATRERIKQIYARLGSTISDRSEVKAAREALALRDHELAALKAELQARSETVGSLQEELHAHGTLADEVARLKSQVKTLRNELGRKDGLQSNSRAALDARIDRLATLLGDVAVPEPATGVTAPESAGLDLEREFSVSSAPAETGSGRVDNPDQGAERS